MTWQEYPEALARRLANDAAKADKRREYMKDYQREYRKQNAERIRQQEKDRYVSRKLITLKEDKTK